MTARFEITIDAQSPARLAQFWSEVLPGYQIRAYDSTELVRLATLGLSPETDTSVALDGNGPTLWFQQVDQPTAQRNRIHFDFKVADRHSEAQRLIRMGAALHEEREDHIVMLDPEGNQFCLFNF